MPSAASAREAESPAPLRDIIQQSTFEPDNFQLLELISSLSEQPRDGAAGGPLCFVLELQ
jgi:hypothetical protein